MSIDAEDSGDDGGSVPFGLYGGGVGGGGGGGGEGGGSLGGGGVSQLGGYWGEGG